MKEVTERLLKWYRQNKILYPWRLTGDPYKIWLSEILLQQTRIPVAMPFFEKIVKQYPTIDDVACESQESFVAEWSGIGYYSRAKNMHSCARELVLNHDGKFPADFERLMELPGIGRYTAGALRNLCFAELTPAVDGNIARVLSRLTLNLLAPEDKGFLIALEKSFLQLGEQAPVAEYFQALMELGERICLPHPRCKVCPVRKFCSAEKAGLENKVPRKRIRKDTIPFFWYFLVLQRSGRLYLVRNQDREFLRDAWLFPDLLTKTRLADSELKSRFLNRWNVSIHSLNHIGSVAHTVTFRKIKAVAIQASEFSVHDSGGKWFLPGVMHEVHTSSVFKKILRLLFHSSVTGL